MCRTTSFILLPSIAIAVKVNKKSIKIDIISLNI